VVASLIFVLLLVGTGMASRNLARISRSRSAMEALSSRARALRCHHASPTSCAERLTIRLSCRVLSYLAYPMEANMQGLGGLPALRVADNIRCLLCYHIMVPAWGPSSWRSSSCRHTTWASALRARWNCNDSAAQFSPAVYRQHGS